MIPTKRYESLHDDYNVAVESFQTIRDATTNVINKAGEGMESVPEAVQSLIDQLKGMKSDAVDSAMDAIAMATRFTDDAFGTFTDLAAIPEKVLNSALKAILPDNKSSVAGKLENTIKTCRTNMGRGLGLAGKMRPISCNGFAYRTAGCSGTDSASILNDILGPNGILTKAINVLENLIRKIVSLASLGFSAGLCGVFAAVTDGVSNKNVLTKAAGILLNAEGKDGNMQAVFDIAKTVASKDLNVPALFGTTITNIAENVKAPLNFAKNTVGNFAQSLISGDGTVPGALGVIDPNYLTSKDGMSSIAKLGDKNSVIERSMAWAGDLPNPVSSLNSVISSAESTASAAYKAAKNTKSSLSDNFLRYA